MDGSAQLPAIDLNDHRVFTALVPGITATARAHLRGLGGPPHGHTVADVVQGCLLDLTRDAARWSIPDEARLRALVRTVVECRLKDLRKSEGRRRARFAYESETPDDQLPEAGSEPDEPSVAPAAMERLRREVDALPERDRSLLASRYALGESFEAMGAAKGADPRTVARRHDRLLATLRARCANRQPDVDFAPGFAPSVDGAVGRRWSPSRPTKESLMKKSTASVPCVAVATALPPSRDPVVLVRCAPWVPPEAVPPVPEGFVAPESADSLPNVNYVGEVHHAELVLALDELSDDGDELAEIADAVGDISHAPELRDRVKGLRVTVVRLERALSAAKLQLIVAVSDGHQMVKAVEREVQHRAARQPQVLDRFPQVVRYGGLQAQRIAEGKARARKSKAQATEAKPAEPVEAKPAEAKPAEAPAQKPADGDKPKG